MEIEWKKIKRMALDESSEREKQEVSEWQEGDKERERFCKDAEAFYREGQEVNDPSREEIERAWLTVRQRTRKHRFISRRVVGWIAGAAVVVGVFFGVRLIMDGETESITNG